MINLIKYLWCVLQVLVVWDIGINKARNYRLFEEVRNRLFSIEICIVFLCKSDLMYLCVLIKLCNRCKLNMYHSLVAGGPRFPGQRGDLPHPVRSDRTLLQPPSPSPRLALPAEALHEPTELLIATVGVHKHNWDQRGVESRGGFLPLKSTSVKDEWRSGTERTSHCGKENCGCIRMLHKDCYFVCNIYQTQSISNRHLVEHY